MVVMFFVYWIVFSSLYAEEPKSSASSMNILFTSVPTEEQQLQRDQILQDYVKRSSEIVIGTIVRSSTYSNKLGYEGEVTISATRWLRGKGEAKDISRLLPYCAPYTQNNPMTVSPSFIKGYNVVLFVNKYGAVIDGNAIFVVIQDHVFRHKTPDVFFNPLYDRKWKESNPHKDYLVYSLSEIEEKIKKDSAFLFIRNLFK